MKKMSICSECGEMYFHSSDDDTLGLCPECSEKKFQEDHEFVSCEVCGDYFHPRGKYHGLCPECIEMGKMSICSECGDMYFHSSDDDTLGLCPECSEKKFQEDYEFAVCEVCDDDYFYPRGEYLGLCQGCLDGQIMRALEPTAEEEAEIRAKIEALDRILYGPTEEDAEFLEFEKGFRAICSAMRMAQASVDKQTAIEQENRMMRLTTAYLAGAISDGDLRELMETIAVSQEWYEIVRMAKEDLSALRDVDWRAPLPPSMEAQKQKIRRQFQRDLDEALRRADE